MKKKTLLLIGIALSTVAAIVLVLLIALGGSASTKVRKVDSVKVQKDGNTLDVQSDGWVSFEKGNVVHEAFWDSNKLQAFFDYIDGKYVGDGDLVTGGQNYITVNGTVYKLADDELIDAVEEETESGGGGGGGPPSPTATAGQGGGGGGSGVPTPTSSGSGGGGGSGGPDPECLYWRLSYCVRPRTPSPSPSPTPEVAEIREPNCEANTQTGRTVIGNDLCVPTPSPTP